MRILKGILLDIAYKRSEIRRATDAIFVGIGDDGRGLVAQDACPAAK